MPARKVSPEQARANKLQLGERFVVSARGALDFGSINAGLQAKLTIAAVGALLGDFVKVGPETDLTAGICLWGYVSAADVVTIIAVNNTAGAVDEASIVYNVSVTRRI